MRKTSGLGVATRSMSISNGAFFARAKISEINAVFNLVRWSGCPRFWPITTNCPALLEASADTCAWLFLSSQNSVCQNTVFPRGKVIEVNGTPGEVDEVVVWA
jgi:hypothetical protein